MHWDPLLHGGGPAAAEGQGHAGRHQEERDHPGRPGQGGTHHSFKAGLRKVFFQVCGKRKERRVCCTSEQEPVQTFGQAPAPVPKKIGTFTNIFHDIAGTAYALNSTTVLIKGFNYDGEGPDAFFLGGTHGRPSKSGEVFLGLFSKIFDHILKLFRPRW